MKFPNTPFSTRLSGSARETELRLRNIFQWKKKRPPVIAFAAAVLVVALCGSMVGFYVPVPEETEQDDAADLLQSLEKASAFEVPCEQSAEKVPIAETYNEQIKRTLIQGYGDHIRSAFLDGETILAPEMQFHSISETYRDALVLTDDEGRLPEGEPERDYSIIRTYENDNVIIRTMTLEENAVTFDGKIPEDIGVEYIWSVLAKNSKVITLLGGLKIGDPSPFGETGSFSFAGRPIIEYSFQDNIITGLSAMTSCDVETLKYKDLSDLRLIYDENGCVNGSELDFPIIYPVEYNTLKELNGYQQPKDRVSVKLGLVSVKTGEQAYQTLLTTNADLPIPEDEMEYVVISLWATYAEGEADQLHFGESYASLPEARLFFGLTAANGDVVVETIHDSLFNNFYNIVLKKGESAQGSIVFLREAGTCNTLTFYGFGEYTQWDISNVTE